MGGASLAGGFARRILSWRCERYGIVKTIKVKEGGGVGRWKEEGIFIVVRFAVRV
jgi:hypothetical protein